MPADAPDRDALLAILDFYVASGVDLALDEEPHNRFSEADAPEPARRLPVVPEPVREQPATPLPPPRPALASPNTAFADARQRAASARSLQELEAIVAAFDGCGLKAPGRPLVFADGVPGSRVMVIGEAPGADEERAGIPFAGRSGQLLDRMLAAIDLDRGSVYLANVVPWRPSGDRPPPSHEIATCLPFTLRQIELSGAEILVTFGPLATNALLGGNETMNRLRGRWFEHRAGNRTIRVLPMLPLHELIRRPLHKRIAWRDLRLLRRALGERAGTGRRRADLIAWLSAPSMARSRQATEPRPCVGKTFAPPNTSTIVAAEVAAEAAVLACRWGGPAGSASARRSFSG